MRGADGSAVHGLRLRRHGRIQDGVTSEIAQVIRRHEPRGRRLLHIQAGQGEQTLIFRDQLTAPERPVIYDESDQRDPAVASATDFVPVDLESARFPAADDYFDLVVWNRDLVIVKNAEAALLEAGRILRPGGLLVLALPNLAALHNRLILLAGRQPTTLHLGNGDHIRGFTISAMTAYLRRDLGFQVERITGVGLAPVTGAVLPGAVRGLSHSAVWALRKPGRPGR